MVRAVAPVNAQPEGTLNEKEAEDGEEEASYFKPEDAAGVNERPPDGLTESFCPTFCSDSDVFGARGVNGRVLPDSLRSLLCGLGSAVAQHSRCDTNTDSQPAANAVQFHRESLRHPRDFRSGCRYCAGELFLERRGLRRVSWLGLPGKRYRGGTFNSDCSRRASDVRLMEYPRAPGRAAERKRSENS